MDLKELVKKAIQTSDKDKVSIAITNLILDDADEVKVFHELYDFVYGDTLCEEKCIEWVNSMHSMEEKGKRWEITQTDELARRLEIDYSKYTKYEFWAACHMIYYDYKDVIKKTSGITDDVIFARFAKAFLEDEDAIKGKLKEYYFHIACN